MPLPLLLAVTPLPSEAFVPPTLPGAPAMAVSPVAPEGALAIDVVETFDSQGRAIALARDLPRTWAGDYQPYGSRASLPVQLRLDSLIPMGQMVDVRGRLTVSGVDVPVQGNLNAKSDQLDLLLLGNTLPPGVEPGGTLLGLQGFSLSAWQPARLSSLGGRLQLAPRALPQREERVSAVAPAAPVPVRGLW